MTSDLNSRKLEIASRLGEVRARTLHLLEFVPEEFLRRRVHSFYSPIGWHFGHVGRTEDYWVRCAALHQAPYDRDLDFLYTDRPDNPKDNRVHVPGREDTVAYLTATREGVLQALEEADLRCDDRLIHAGYGWEFAIQHECQHQETICEMLCLIQREIGPRKLDARPWISDLRTDFVGIKGGTFRMGSDEPSAYDNEARPHEVTVAPFRLARAPVTCFEWSQFMAEDGYQRPEFWTSEGWEWRQREDAMAPFYWFSDGERRGSYAPTGARALEPDEPVTGISHYEAEAFASWCGARLPTEAEWEFAARAGNFPWGDDAPTASHARYGMEGWAPAPVGSKPAGRSLEGLHDLAGNTWEWTASAFLPYPGFQAFPYDGYSKDHMLGEHRVCRGGSWATSAPILRRTFRNWYVPGYRQGFLGLRLAQDA